MAAMADTAVATQDIAAAVTIVVAVTGIAMGTAAGVIATGMVGIGTAGVGASGKRLAG